MKLYFLLLFTAIPFLAVCQNEVTGQVLDAETNDPVPGATVYIPRLEQGTMTDMDGRFQFQNIADGKFRLVISSLGYASKTLNFTSPPEGPLEIFLAPSAIEMEEIIISTPFHQLQSENVMRVERATVESLTRTGAINLVQGISEIPGVETLTTGSGIGKPVIRGLSSNRVLVYTQGVRLENQQYGDEHGLGVNSAGIESVEVIKGPASLLYGSDALGGVLYLNPERYAPADSTMFDAGTSYFTNTLGLQADAGLKTSTDRWRFLVRGAYESHSDYETGSNERVTNTRYNEWDLKTGIGYRNDFYRGDLRYNLNSSRNGIPEEIGVQSTDKHVLEPYQGVNNHILSLDNTFYMEGSSLNVKLGYLFNDRNEFEDHEAHSDEHDHEHDEEDHEQDEDEHYEVHGEEAALQMHLETINYDVKYHLPKMGNFETIFGLQGMFQQNSNFGEEILIPDARLRDIGLLGTTHYHLDNFDVQAGIRYDNRNIETSIMEIAPEMPQVNRSFDSYNGALGMKYNFTSNFVGRLNFSTGFRAPNLAELTSYGSHHGTNRFEIGNPNLGNEQNYQLDLALEYRNEHFEVFTNTFYNNINNYIFLDPSGEVINDDAVFHYVQNDAELYGGEMGLHIHPHPIHWLHLESSYELVIGKQDNGTYLPLIPAQIVVNTLRIEYEQTTWAENAYSFISVRSVFDQDRVSTFETPTGGYSLLNAGLGGTFHLDGTALELQISGRNLLNKTYISHLSRLKPDGIPNMGRNIAVRLRASF